jgi:RND family efflux transporter MFP subunit
VHDSRNILPRRLVINKRVLRLFSCVATVAMLCLNACSKPAGHQAMGMPGLTVTTAPVQRGDIATYATFNGQISPLYQSTLTTMQSGNVESINVTEGDFVHKGQLLATIDTSQLQAQLKANEALVDENAAGLVKSNIAAPVNSQQYTSGLASAQQTLLADQNAVNSANAALRQAELTAKADQALFKQGYVSETALLQARASLVSAQETLRSANQALPAAQEAVRAAQQNTTQRQADQATIDQSRATLDNAHANVDLLRAQIAQSSIVAPYDGQITERLIDPGSYAGTSTPILQISHIASVYIVANVPDVDLATVMPGKDITFTSSSLPGHTYTARVYDVNTTPTSGTLSYRVRILQANPSFQLRGGMLVVVKTVRDAHKNVLLIPHPALLQGLQGNIVYTVVDGKAKAIPVTVGITTDETIEVSGAGLTAGTPVINNQPLGLQDGAPVQVATGAHV